MAKIGLLATGLIAAMSIGAGSLSANNNLAKRDAQIIVEVDPAVRKSGLYTIRDSQDLVMNAIRSLATKNICLEERFTVLNNAFVLSVNSDDIEAIKNVPGVASVTLNTIHWKRTINHDVTLSVRSAPDVVEENISATTMQKPTETNDGEGTVMAILDNEFYFRGQVGSEAAWKHEVYGELADSVAKKFTYDGLTQTLAKTHAKRKAGTTAGQEGSLYFNNKVPFYYDYGGTTKTYGGDDSTPDYDVHSDVDYHGSHVSSITAANAPTYKGIAPKAQLACMKVFTEYKADAVGDSFGFSTYSGAYDRVILSALEDCITLGVDGINMSLGSDLDDFDSDSITVKTLGRLAQSGILTSISNGNSGKESYEFAGAYGNWTNNMVETGIMSSYPNNKYVTAVASGQPDQIYYKTALNLGDTVIAYDDQVVNREGMPDDYATEHKLEELISNPSDTLEYVYTGKFGASSDYNKIDADGKIVIVNRGSTSFEDKYNQAVAAQAKGLIIINNDPTASDFNFRCSFGDTEPTIPVSLLLFKDKQYFEAHPAGSFSLLTKQVSANEKARTISTFSTDGATYDYDLKPEITAPGDIVRGAVPPQTKEDKADTPFNTYQYLSGTSMSAPNYTGAQSVVLSEVAKDIYAGATNGNITAENKAKLDAYRSTVDMRLMSTAVPMFEVASSPEEAEHYVDEANKKNYTSPRRQGAGMVNLGGALSTDVFLEGYDLQGNLTKKSKLALHNNADIAKGDIKLSFMAHNESSETRTYNAKLTVMRPATALNNGIVTGEYNIRGQVDALTSLPGITYYDPNGTHTDTTVIKKNDVIVVGTTIEYWANEENYNLDHTGVDKWDATSHEHSVILEKGNYYCPSDYSVSWEPLPDKVYQSVKDTLIAQVSLGTVEVPAGDTKIDLNTYSLSEEVKAEILELYPFGCAIEGYLALESTQGKTNLSMPFLGFYSGTDKNAEASYESAPVVEEFEFEKDPTQVYPSDLANDIAKSLVGKDNADMGSLWVSGYAKSTDSINKDKILTNDMSFAGLTGFRNVGTDPYDGTYYENPKDNIYVGNPYESNTMIIQQFVLRSVADNYFEIVNKETGETVYKSVLEDMLFGETAGKYPLYKSHVEAGYLSSGYVAHRAYAIIPLYDVETGEAFASGDYEIKFNYQLAATGNWVDKSYDFHIDSESPVVKGITTYQNEGEEYVRVDFEDMAMSYAAIGYNLVDVYYDEAKGTYYAELPRAEFDEYVAEMVGESSAERVYISGVDRAGGKIGAVIHFNKDFSKVEMVQSSELLVKHDFRVNNGVLSFVEIDLEGVETETTLTRPYSTSGIDLNPQPAPTPSNGGCGGSVVAVSSLSVSLIALMSALIIKRRKSK